jgi:hypothetical protein
MKPQIFNEDVLSDPYKMDIVDWIVLSTLKYPVSKEKIIFKGRFENYLSQKKRPYEFAQSYSDLFTMTELLAFETIKIDGENVEMKSFVGEKFQNDPPPFKFSNVDVFSFYDSDLEKFENWLPRKSLAFLIQTDKCLDISNAFKYFEEGKEFYVSSNGVKGGLLGFLKIKNIRGVAFSVDNSGCDSIVDMQEKIFENQKINQKLNMVISKFTPLSRDSERKIFDMQDELIKQDLEEFAKL